MPSIIERFRNQVGEGVKASSGSKRGLPQGNAWGNPSSNGWWNRIFGMQPGAKVDYRALADPAWLNSIVGAALNYIGRNLPQAPPCIYWVKPNGDEKIIPGHPLEQLLKRPNKYYDGLTLRKATFLSLIAGRGDAYWWIRRNNDGSPRELWYLPHWQCWPIWKTDSTTDDWITGYCYRNVGVNYYIDFEDIIHFRDGLNPYNMRGGLDPIGSAYRELVHDNETSGFNVALLKNMGVVPVVISPKDATGTLQDGDMELIKAMYEENSTGDNRGRPLVVDGSVDVQKLALSPSEMMMDRISARDESRIASLIGIHPISLGLEIGLERSTFENTEQAEKMSWYGGIIPRLDLINSACDVQLLPYYPGYTTKRVGANLKNVLALQENREIQFKSISMAVANAAWLTVNEARSLASFDPIEGGDESPAAMAQEQHEQQVNQTAAQTEAIQNPPKPNSPAKGWVTIDGHHVLIEKGKDNSSSSESGGGGGKPGAEVSEPEAVERIDKMSPYYQNGYRANEYRQTKEQLLANPKIAHQVARYADASEKVHGGNHHDLATYGYHLSGILRYGSAENLSEHRAGAFHEQLQDKKKTVETLAGSKKKSDRDLSASYAKDIPGHEKNIQDEEQILSHLQGKSGKSIEVL